MWRDRTNLTLPLPFPCATSTYHNSYISYRQSYVHHPTQRSSRYGLPSSSSSTAALGGLSFRDDDFSTADESRRGLLSAGAADLGANGDGGDAVIEMDVLPPRWADASDEVADLLAAVARDSIALDRVHQRHLLPAFNDDGPEEGPRRRADEREIERLTQAVTRALHDCHARVQRVGKMAAGRGLSKADEQMARNIQVALATRVQEASAAFRKKQSAYLKKLRGANGIMSPLPPDRSSTSSTAFAGNHPSLLAANGAADPSSTALLLETDADRSFSQSTLQAQQHKKLLHSDDAVISAREREIDLIAQGIIDLADMFRDLQAMVIDQGTMLDRVDYNVERMATDVKEADRELNIASGHQKKTTKRKIILLLLLVIAGMIILLVLKPKGRREGGGDVADDGGREAVGPVIRG